MNNIIGIAAFGLNDSFCTEKSADNREFKDYLPSAIILPSKERRDILTGPKAKTDRCNLGWNNPEDALVNDFTKMRRVLLGLLWRRFTDVKEQHSAIQNPVGGNFYCSSLISDYIRKTCNILEKKGVIGKEKQLIVAIPNELDEYAQSYLLQDLASPTIAPTLIWRSVAAAMYMLQNSEDLTSRDKICVLYLGPDAVEVTKFDLKEKIGEKTGKHYLLPVRKRAVNTNSLTGYELVLNILRQSDHRMWENYSKEWQALNLFPDLWKAAAGIESSSHRCSQLYWNEDKWEINSSSWTPVTDLSSVSQSKLIRDLLPGNAYQESSSNCDDCYENLLKKIIGKLENYDSLLICGPMSSELLAKSIASIFRREYSGDLARSGCVWFSEEDPIAFGAYLYGERLAADEPTYFDQLPWLKLAYRQNINSDYEWADLVTDSECEGGKTYHSDDIEKFCVDSGGQSLDVYLKKQSNDSNDEGIRFGSARFKSKARENIRLVIKVEMKAASGLAKIRFFSKDSNYLPPHGQIFDYSGMKPAKLPEIKPTYPIFFDFETGPLFLKAKNKLSGSLIIFKTFRQGNSVKQLADTIEYFGRCIGSAYNGKRYINVEGRSSDPEVNEIIDESLSMISSIFDNRRFVNLMRNKKLAEKEGNEKIYRVPWYLSKLLGKTPEFAKNEIRKRLKKAVSGEIGDLRVLFPAACKVLHSEQDIKDLFTLFKQTTVDENGRYIAKNYHASGINYLMLHVKKACDFLTEDVADRMIKAGISILETEAKKCNYKIKFYSTATMIISALCYRKKSPDYMKTEKKNDNLCGSGSHVIKRLNEIFDKGIQYQSNKIKRGQKVSSRDLSHKQLSELLEQTQKFFLAQGDQSFIRAISEKDSGEDESEADK